ncbi:hypothetical protein [Pseudomonas borbori]|uniref:Uncharacterized protein n=1 Tax=Pseudomonas borbori TaxID=289003 RepID=A0A1I5VJX2_9PSED|nr:hypothetical protein [Pseudomonas borbori]SFQ07805.1 hypothetical protein SAMN05216190_13159 [Pseudomonas borbori]
MSRGFLTFDPFRTFAEGEKGVREKIFVTADGTPTESKCYGKSRDGKVYLLAAWRIGQEAYSIVADRLGQQPTISDFVEIAEAIRALEATIAHSAQDVTDDDTDQSKDKNSESLSDVETIVDGSPEKSFLLACTQALMPKIIFEPNMVKDLPDFDALLSAAAVMKIDGYILCEQLGSSDQDLYLQDIMTYATAAKLFKQTLTIAQEVISAQGKKSATARHKQTNEQKAIALNEWDARGNTYSSSAAFARFCHKKYGVTERTLCDWVREHRKTKT